MKTILIIHDLFSSINDIFIQKFIQSLRQYKIIVPELPTYPEEAMEMLKDICRQEQPELIIGWLGGGFFAQQLTAYSRIVISPEYQPSATLNALLKGHKSIDLPYTCSRCDGDERLHITPSLVKAYAKMEDQQFDGISGSSNLVFGFFWFYHNQENLQIHQEHYHDVCFLPGKDLFNHTSIQAICHFIQSYLEEPEE